VEIEVSCGILRKGRIHVDHASLTITQNAHRSRRGFGTEAQ
jgi:hypothetical protein